jgi:hypothetical protein
MNENQKVETTSIDKLRERKTNIAVINTMYKVIDRLDMNLIRNLSVMRKEYKADRNSLTNFYYKNRHLFEKSFEEMYKKFMSCLQEIEDIIGIEYDGYLRLAEDKCILLTKHLSVAKKIISDAEHKLK